MDTDDLHLILDKANELLEAGNPTETLRCLAEIEDQLVEAEDRIDCASLQAWALSELDRSSEALRALEPALREFPTASRLHTTRGVVLSNGGDLEGACDALETAVALDSEDDVAIANLALVYERLREYEHALELYEKAIDMGAEIDWLLQRKSSVHAELGDFAMARTTLKRYLSLAPDDAEQWIALGGLLCEEHDFQQAFVAYRSAEQIAPDSPSLRLNWGVSAVQAEDFEVAEQQLKYLKRVDADGARPLLLEAIMAESRSKLQRATEKFVDALARLRGGDANELAYTVETAMDFFCRNSLDQLAEQLIEQAYLNNVCTVEVCESYRNLVGQPVENAQWFSVIVEFDYRKGLVEVADRRDWDKSQFTRCVRNYQVVARNHDEAIGLVMGFADRMGETNVVLREFVNTEPMDEACIGIYEVERESLVFLDEPAP